MSRTLGGVQDRKSSALRENTTGIVSHLLWIHNKVSLNLCHVESCALYVRLYMFV